MTSVAGILDPYYLQSDSMQTRLNSRVRSFLKLKLRISPDDLHEAAERVLDLSLMAFRLIPLRLTVFEALRVNHKQELSRKADSSAPKPSASDDGAGTVRQMALL